MEKIVIIFFYVNLIVSVSIAQNYSSEEQLLTSLKSEGKYLEYFKEIDILGEKAFVDSNLIQLFSLSDKLKIDRNQLTGDERTLARRVAIGIGDNTWRLSGDYDRILNIYLIAHDYVDDKLHLDTLAWYAENRIAVIYTILGDYDQSKYYYSLVEESLKFYKRYKFLTRHYTNVGRNLNSEYKLEEAIESFLTGLHLSDSIEYPSGIFANAINLAETYNNLNKPDSVKKYLTIADNMRYLLQDDRRINEKNASYTMELARYYSSIYKYRESIPLFREAIMTLMKFYPNSRRREFAKYYYAFAYALSNLDSITQAEEIIRKGFASIIPGFAQNKQYPDKEQLYAENTFIDLFSLIAELEEKKYLQSGDTIYIGKALHALDLALYVNFLIRERVIADPSKLVLIRNNKQIVEQAVAMMHDYYAAKGFPIQFNLIRKYFSQSKSLLYNDKISKNYLLKYFSLQDFNEWQRLKNEIYHLYQQRLEDVYDINTINKKILEQQSILEDLFRKYDSVHVEKRIVESYVEFLSGENNIYVLSEVADVLRFKRIGTISRLDSLLARMGKFIYEKGYSNDYSVLSELYQYLIDPVLDSLPQQLIIVPDGSIGFIPFEMLKSGDDKYVVEKTAVSYALEYETFRGDQGEGIFDSEFFGLVPSYGDDFVEVNQASRGGLYPLPYAKAEIDSIRKLFVTGTYVSESSDKNELKYISGNSRIFHYAGHAIVNQDNAYLALSNQADESLQLTKEEIGLMHWPIDLVVLSACETGLGQLNPGEGISSLGRAFMEAGAKSTLISLWNVNDKSTASIIVSFYNHLKEGLNKDEALRLSKLEYIQKAKKFNNHPYFWAPFIIMGAMDSMY